jgi:hypothetical protein
MVNLLKAGYKPKAKNHEKHKALHKGAHRL